MLKEPLDILKRRRAEQEEKRKGRRRTEQPTANKEKGADSSSEENIAEPPAHPSDRAVYIDERMWRQLQERYTIHEQEARQMRATGIMLTETAEENLDRLIWAAL